MKDSFFCSDKLIQETLKILVQREPKFQCNTIDINDTLANIEKLTSINHHEEFKNNASVSMIHSVPELKVSYAQAQELGKADEEKLLESRKLVLLVDLDQTLIHTTNQPSEQINCKDVVSFRLYGSNSQLYYTKLRPYTNKFLEEISKLYELHICTFGARMYAHKIAEILDPEKKLFSHRILSRDECFDPQLKTANLKALFPCGDSMVCIIDDREDVWNYQPNLVSVKPYTFFKNTGDINSPNKQKDDMLENAAKVMSEINVSKKPPDSSEENISDKTKDESEVSKTDDVEVEKVKEAQGANTKSDLHKDEKKISDEPVVDKEKIVDKVDSKNEDLKSSEVIPNEIEDDDDYLLYLLEILKKIHTKFFKEYDEIKKYSVEGEHIQIPHLKKLIPVIRREVLKGVNIVFTGLVPTRVVPEQSKIWILAKQLGANVSRDIIKDGSPLEKTTHVVASNLNTIKVQAASKLKNIHIVNPLWLYNCAKRWEKVKENLYFLTKDDDYKDPKKSKEKLTADEQLFLYCDLIRFPSFFNELKSQNILNFDRNHQYLINNSSKTKAIESNDLKATTSKKIKDDESFPKNESLQPHSMVELSPLSAFSASELKMMDQEVDDACSDEEESAESAEEIDDDEENLIFDYCDEPKKKKLKKDIESLTSSSEESNLSFEDSNSNMEEMGAALEKDFLS
ncbi:hypothetical protein RND71_043942 [Anisodus tanguticus]|uniref:RNA polymerase II C-terminal domain phosphatase-like n=1 Tax=Anisodus tanguticus TaxID=243964 RepID=A0AAE1UR31_9SOLA|nr:hypothetical protein RND71_043942 [Anisodus tanguticus]